MSDHFSLGSADSTSASNAPACVSCGNARPMTTAVVSWPDVFPESDVIPTCVVCGGLISRRLTSSPQAGLARASVTPGEARDSITPARVFGPRSSGLFLTFDPATWSWRTSQLSLLEESDVFSGTWPRSGMTRSGTAYRLQPLALPTGATASGSWPTPTARDHKDTGNLSRVPENSLLPRVVQRREGWPTPTARDRHTYAKVKRGARSTVETGGGTPLVMAVSPGGPPDRGGQLNPTWVEWLMGFPTGWTDLEASGTPSSPKSPSGSATGSSSMNGGEQ
jgi:hypothetical protein